MTVRLPRRNRRGMLRLAYPGACRGTLIHGQVRYELVDLSQEGARIAAANGNGYREGSQCELVLCLVSRAVLATTAEVVRVTPAEVAFRFQDLHFPFTLMLEEHCAVLEERGAASLR
jgi:PilZ domain-containing protein